MQRVKYWMIFSEECSETHSQFNCRGDDHLISLTRPTAAS